MDHADARKQSLEEWALLVRRRGGDQWRSIYKLMDHADARKQSLEEWKLFQNSVVDPIIGKLNINSASFRFSGERAEGRGLYPTLSLVSHSCVANARYQGGDKFNHR